MDPYGPRPAYSSFRSEANFGAIADNRSRVELTVSGVRGRHHIFACASGPLTVQPMPRTMPLFRQDLARIAIFSDSSGTRASRFLDSSSGSNSAMAFLTFFLSGQTRVRLGRKDCF